MLLVGAGRAGLGVYCLDPHQVHQTNYPFAVDLEAKCLQVMTHPTRAKKWGLQILLVDESHQSQVLGALGPRLVIERRTVEAQQFALPGNT